MLRRPRAIHPPNNDYDLPRAVPDPEDEDESLDEVEEVAAPTAVRNADEGDEEAPRGIVALEHSVNKFFVEAVVRDGWVALIHITI